MMTKKHAFLIIILVVLSFGWLHFLGQNGMIIRRYQLNFEKLRFPAHKMSDQTDMTRQPSLKMTPIYWIFFVLHLTACLYKIASDFRSDHKWEYLKKCDILRFLQRQNMTVMCLDDYFRDRLNNNLSAHDLMKYEWVRYESFKTYPDTAPHFPSALARDGFYYTGDGTFVKCFCCGHRLDTTEHDAIAEGHIQCSPNCRFARGETNANVPIRHGTVNSRTRLNANDGQPAAVQPASVQPAAVQPASVHLAAVQPASVQSPAVQSTAVRHPTYATVISRRNSYHNWPKTSPAITMQLAEAGFFYIGTDDKVVCFSCGKGFRGWLSNDDPWKVHALYSPQCQHVKRCKGEDFVTRVRSTLSPNGTSLQETHSSSRLSRDLQSRAAQIVLQMGHSVTRLTHAIRHIRLEQGDGELSAKTLIEYIHDTEPNLAGPNSYNRTLLALALAARSNLNDADRPVRPPVRTVREIGIQHNTDSSELRAQYILEYLLDNSYSCNDANGHTSSNITDRDKQSTATSNTLDDGNAQINNKAIDMKEEHKQLLKENHQLRNQMICKICLDKDACVVFLPCGHMVSCVECAHALRKCAVCRSLIQGSVRAYPA